MTMTPRKRWLVITACWAVLYVFFALGEVADQTGKLHPLATAEVFKREFLSDVLWVPLTYFALWFSRLVPIAAPKRLRSLVIQLAVSTGVAAVHIAVLAVLLAAFGFEVDGAGAGPKAATLISDNLQGDLLCYWVIFGIAFAVDAYRAKPDKQTDSKPEFEAATLEPASRIPVKSNGRITLVETDDVDWFEADDNYVRVHTGERSHLVRERIGRLESQLDPSRFLRIHRSVIVNKTRVKELRPVPGGVYEVIMKDGKTVRSGRKFKAHVASLISR